MAKCIESTDCIKNQSKLKIWPNTSFIKRSILRKQTIDEYLKEPCQEI